MLPSSIPSFQYPKSFKTRRVNNNGDMSWLHGRVFVSEVLRNEEIGLEQMDDTLPTPLGNPFGITTFPQLRRRLEYVSGPANPAENP